MAKVNMIVQEKSGIEEDLHKLWDLDSVGIRKTDDVHSAFLRQTSISLIRHFVCVFVRLSVPLPRPPLLSNNNNNIHLYSAKTIKIF